MVYKENIDEKLSMVHEEDVQMEFSGFYEERKKEDVKNKEIQNLNLNEYIGKNIDFDFLNLIPKLLQSYYADKEILNSPINQEKITVISQRILGKSRLKLNKIDSLLQIHSESFCLENPKCLDCPINKFCQTGRKVASIIPNEEIPFADLFCGAGGLSEGMEFSGLRPEFALDHDEAATNTYLINRPFFDSNKLYTGDIGEFLEKYKVPKSPIVVGGPPCQGFSNANKQAVPDDERNYLYKKFIEFVHKSDAEFVVMENVEGITKFQHFIEKDFLEIGFFIKPYIVNTKEFGFPQNRKRVFFFGYKTTDIIEFGKMCLVFEKELKISKIKQVYTLKDAIADLPILKAKTIRNNNELENEDYGFTVIKNNTQTPYQELINSGNSNYIFNHRSKYNNDRDIEIYGRLQQGDKSDSPLIADINPYTNREGIFKDKFYKLKYDDYCKTITAHMYYDCHMYIHPTQARGLTPREAARIQGFSDDYYFSGTPNEWYRQIGNAVSPLMARHIGAGLKKVYLSKYGS